MRLLFITIILIFSLNSWAHEHEKQGEYLGAKIVDELPNWFKATFMDFSEDLEEAADEGRHVMIYFHQDGCPYCAKLVQDNFHDDDLVAKLQKDFDVIETNMWGDRELTDWQGDDYTEKEFSAKMKIQFTPTILFLNTKGKTLLRLNGYQSIAKMHATLDYISSKTYLDQSYASYMNSLKTDKAGTLNAHAIFEQGPHMLTRNIQMPASKYLAVFFEEPNCSECDNFYQTLMPLKETQSHLKQMQVVRFNALSDEKLITPAGKRTTAKDWFEDLKLTYKPAIVFFDKTGEEIIRKDAFFKAYHTHGIMTYVLTGAYKTQPNFQRYLEHKSDVLREQGITVDLWK
ncbi:thioredoxin fold domain-containing protein [Candidatus Thioglobus sp.]|jgi:thioredoxin-related protein|uniref:thioredoxin fold domain-containing protein n=1 Tax=Candidatus Thioglobus sp. TaxID=2026721 RepID=UPI001D8265C3|nr:thioredoxin fold domain-containing protein [Candidatus Thioglobus sp.]MBT3276759.1 thioredoxin fold domain-containing protein [Candidatus Thioglobus sp.]MBT3447358.1 thioredoxin fold domain-containing protein [Candidatus Thioglobus sp.]MBT3745092.1 thioredoxin fold domain-containing protein [Candidatus Thioglobus sp.]MBT4001675.1 thioredoxin fold domain-containing protein [Candidatus Thioglobus sp.]MBT4182211.1 thioredoxin fold domain-containing protein [Candidatus Thioglobus sp.]